MSYEEQLKNLYISFKTSRSFENQPHECKHKNVIFVGLYSLVGKYGCKDCGILIEPYIYHQEYPIDLGEV